MVDGNIRTTHVQQLDHVLLGTTKSTGEPTEPPGTTTNLQTSFVEIALRQCQNGPYLRYVYKRLDGLS